MWTGLDDAHRSRRHCECWPWMLAQLARLVRWLAVQARQQVQDGGLRTHLARSYQEAVDLRTTFEDR